MNLFALWSAQMALGVETSRMMVAANRVVAERLYGKIAGDPVEMWRMVAEKGPAFAKGAFAGMTAAGAVLRLRVRRCGRFAPKPSKTPGG